MAKKLAKKRTGISPNPTAPTGMGIKSMKMMGVKRGMTPKGEVNAIN